MEIQAAIIVSLATIIGALVGVISGSYLSQAAVRQIHKARRIANWHALRAEIEFNGSLAATYVRNEAPKAPLYRTSNVCFTAGFPILLQDGTLAPDEPGALLEFYNHCDQLHRGLELVDELRRMADDPTIGSTKASLMKEPLDRQIRRCLLKAERLASPSGEFFKPAINVARAHLGKRADGVFQRFWSWASCRW